MRSMFGMSRGKLTPGLMLVLAAVAIVLAVGIWWLTQQRRTEKQAEFASVTGAVSNFQYDRDAGINPPYAGQAAAGTVVPEAVLEAPIAWKDLTYKTLDNDVSRAVEAIGKKLTKDGEIYSQTLTMKIDRDLTYRQFYTAYSKAVEAGFQKIQVECYKSPKDKAPVYLSLNPPTGVAAPKGVLYFRLQRDGGAIRYFLGGSNPKEYAKLMDVYAVLKKMKDDGKIDATKTLVVWPEPECSVQNFIEAVNVGVDVGFQNISLKAVNMND
jgi:hypothetical protein